MFGLPIPHQWLLTGASAIIILTGLAQIFLSGKISKEFKLVLFAHKKILSMALVSQGVAILGIGILIAVATFAMPFGSTSRMTAIFCAVLLLILAIWIGSTGGQTEKILYRASSILLILASLLILAAQREN